MRGTIQELPDVEVPLSEPWFESLSAQVRVRVTGPDESAFDGCGVVDQRDTVQTLGIFVSATQCLARVAVIVYWPRAA